MPIRGTSSPWGPMGMARSDAFIDLRVATPHIYSHGHGSGWIMERWR